MAKFDHPKFKASFELPDDPTILDLLTYDEFELRPTESMYPRLWKAVQSIAQKWECEALPLSVGIDDVADAEQMEIIKWAALAGISWRQAQKEDKLPKNS